MMNEKHMPKSYWAEAVNTVVDLMSRCTTSGVHEVTPHERYYGKKPDLLHTRIFGSIAYVVTIFGYGVKPSETNKPRMCIIAHALS